MPPEASVAEKTDQQNQGSAPAFRTVLTFERDGGDPVVVRDRFVEIEPDVVARKAVFRALPQAPRKWDSIVLVIDRL